MKIALFGHGRMSELLVQLVNRSTSHTIVNDDDFNHADVAIDFSHHSVVLPHLSLCIEHNKPLVIGTTGWEEQLDTAKALVKANPQMGCLYSPNFSVGIYLFKQIAAYAAALLQPWESYDACGIEYHHRHKVDAPSGTAKALTTTVRESLPRKPGFQFTSVRCGEMPGKHSILFDSLCDTITLTHDARSPSCFGEGALLAAEWLLHRKGFFTFDEMMQERESSSQKERCQ